MFIASNNSIWPNDQEESNFVHTLSFLLLIPWSLQLVFTFILFLPALPGVVYAHAKFEKVEALLNGQAHCLKTHYFNVLFHDLNDMGNGE